MDIVILTGLSGAGKSQAAAFFEDQGYFCIDNLPPQVVPELIRTFLKGQGGWSGHDQPVILTVIKRPEIAQMRALVREVDEHAFFIVTEAKDVFGKNFENIQSVD